MRRKQTADLQAHQERRHIQSLTMEAHNTAPEKQRLSFSIPLETATGSSPSIRNLRANQGLNESQLSFRIPTNEDAAIHVHDKHGHHSWQAKILKVIHAKWFQRTIICLLILDILLLFTELFLLATVSVLVFLPFTRKINFSFLFHSFPPVASLSVTLSPAVLLRQRQTEPVVG